MCISWGAAPDPGPRSCLPRHRVRPLGCRARRCSLLPRRLPATLARGGAPSRPRPPLPLRVPRGGQEFPCPPRGSLDGDPPLACSAESRACRTFSVKACVETADTGERGGGQRMVALVPPGHRVTPVHRGRRLLPPARPPARSLRTRPPDGRTPSRALPPVAPYDGAPRPPGGRGAHRAELVAPPRGPPGPPRLPAGAARPPPQGGRGPRR